MRDQVKGHLAKFSVQMKHKWMGNRGTYFPSFPQKKSNLQIFQAFFLRSYDCHPSVCFKTICIFRLTSSGYPVLSEKQYFPLTDLSSQIFLFTNLGLDGYISMFPLLSPPMNGYRFQTLLQHLPCAKP